MGAGGRRGQPEALHGSPHSKFFNYWAPTEVVKCEGGEQGDSVASQEPIMTVNTEFSRGEHNYQGGEQGDTGSCQ